MVKNKIYPNYWDYFYYEEGNETIKLVRKVGAEIIYTRYMTFDTVEEAAAYWEDYCGA